MNHHQHHQRRRRRAQGGFTLIELLVTMGLITILSTITIVSVQNLLSEARLSTATNTVKVALGNARALAMKNNQTIAVVFVVDWDADRPDRPQVVEMVTAAYSGETTPNNAFGGLIDRFQTLPGVPRRRLPPGIKIAGPWYDLGFGDPNYRDWVTQPHFPSFYQDVDDAEQGRLIGVMFSPRGEVITRRTDGLAGRNYAYIDLNGNGEQDAGSASASQEYWRYDEPGDEARANFVPYLAIFDDRAARELYPGSETAWVGDGNWNTRREQISDFVNEFSDRIHFNRYTGVVMK